MTNQAVGNSGCEPICDGFWRSGRWSPLCRTNLWPRIQQLFVRLGTPSLPGPARNPFQPTLIRQESFFNPPSLSPASLTASAPLPAQRLFDNPPTLELRLAADTSTDQSQWKTIRLHSTWRASWAVHCVYIPRILECLLVSSSVPMR